MRGARGGLGSLWRGKSRLGWTPGRHSPQGFGSPVRLCSHWGSVLSRAWGMGPVGRCPDFRCRPLTEKNSPTRMLRAALCCFMSAAKGEGLAKPPVRRLPGFSTATRKNGLPSSPATLGMTTGPGRRRYPKNSESRPQWGSGKWPGRSARTASRFLWLSTATVALFTRKKDLAAGNRWKMRSTGL